MDKKEKDKLWRQNATKQFLLRFTNTSGVPEAISAAAKNAGMKETEYMKTAIVCYLRKDGFMSGIDYVPNLNKARHREKIERLKKYIEEEEKKIK